MSTIAFVYNGALFLSQCDTLISRDKTYAYLQYIPRGMYENKTVLGISTIHLPMSYIQDYGSFCNPTPEKVPKMWEGIARCFIIPESMDITFLSRNALVNKNQIQASFSHEISAELIAAGVSFIASSNSRIIEIFNYLAFHGASDKEMVDTITKFQLGSGDKFIRITPEQWKKLYPIVKEKMTVVFTPAFIKKHENECLTVM